MGDWTPQFVLYPNGKVVHIKRDVVRLGRLTLCANLHPSGVVRPALEWEVNNMVMCRSCQRTWKYKELIVGSEEEEGWR